MRMGSLTGAVLVGLVAALFPVQPAAADCTWTMTALPMLDGYTRSHVSAAADGRWSVGEMSGGGLGDTAVRWHGDQVENLGRAFDKQTELHDVNSSGVAVGMTWANADIDAAIVYRAGRFEYLPRPPGTTRVRAKRINDAGDIVGAASTGRDDVQVLLWPAASPGTVLMVNPDPHRYWSTAPVDLDEQGRILIEANTADGTENLVWHPDSTVTTIPSTSTTWLDGFRDGRVVGQTYVPGRRMVGTEWDLTGQVVHQLAERVQRLVVDSGTTIAGVYRDGTEYRLGVWENGILTATLEGSPYPILTNPATLTDDGVLAATISPLGANEHAAVTYHRTC